MSDCITRASNEEIELLKKSVVRYVPKKGKSYSIIDIRSSRQGNEYVITGMVTDNEGRFIASGTLEYCTRKVSSLLNKA